jgi:hypothetical protein
MKVVVQVQKRAQSNTSCLLYKPEATTHLLERLAKEAADQHETLAANEVRAANLP